MKRSAFNSLIGCEVYILSLDTNFIKGVIRAKIIEIGEDGVLFKVIKSNHSSFSVGDLVFSSSATIKHISSSNSESPYEL